MDYSGKAQSVMSAVNKLSVALSQVPGIDYAYNANKRIGVISVFNTSTGEWDKEAVVNIYWDQTSNKVFYTLHNWPNSNVPFESMKDELDYDKDGVIEIEDILAITMDLFGKLNG